MHSIDRSDADIPRRDPPAPILSIDHTRMEVPMTVDDDRGRGTCVRGENESVPVIYRMPGVGQPEARRFAAFELDGRLYDPVLIDDGAAVLPLGTIAFPETRGTARLCLFPRGLADPVALPDGRSARFPLAARRLFDGNRHDPLSR